MIEIELFKKHGQSVLDWMDFYLKNVESFKVLSDVKPGDIRRSLPLSPSSEPQDFERI